MTNPMLPAASYPPLQKAQGRGTRSFGTGRESAKSWATRRSVAGVGGGGDGAACVANDYTACVTATPRDVCVALIGGTDDAANDPNLSSVADIMGWNYIAPYGNGVGSDLATQAYDALPLTDLPCDGTCQNAFGQINRLEQANPQGLLLLSWSGGAQPINQGAGSGALNTSGISGIIYLSPGSPAGYAPDLNNTPTFTYWGSGTTNSAVYAANGIMPNGGETTPVFTTLPPGPSATIPGCDHNFQCDFDSGVLSSIVSDCNTSTRNRADDDQDDERYVLDTEDTYDEKGIAEVGTWPMLLIPLLME